MQDRIFHFYFIDPLFLGKKNCVACDNNGVMIQKGKFKGLGGLKNLGGLGNLLGRIGNCQDCTIKGHNNGQKFNFKTDNVGSIKGNGGHGGFPLGKPSDIIYKL